MKKAILVSLLTMAGFSIMAQDAVDLRLNLEKNKAYRFRSTSVQNITQTINGVQQTSTVNTRNVSSIRVMDVKPEFLVAEIRFDTMITTTNTMGKLVTMNSANNGNIASGEMAEVMSCILNRLSKNPLYAKISYSGKVLEIVNAKMLSEIILKDTAQITGATASALKTQAAGNADPKTLISMVEMVTGELPGNPVKKGETWTSTNSINSGGMSLDIVTTYELGQAGESVTGVIAESDIHPSPNAVPIKASGATVDYQNLRGTGKSNIELDRQTGLTLKSSTKTHITGTLQVSAQGFNIQMPMEVDGESSTVAIQ